MDAHNDYVMSVAFSPDGTKIVSGSYDEMIKVWDSGAPRALKIAPPWRKLTHAGLSGRQTGAAEREDERPQQAYQFGGIFPRWHEDRVRMQWRDDQCLGFGCAKPSKSRLLGQN
jgi:hypothetical protein